MFKNIIFCCLIHSFLLQAHLLSAESKGKYTDKNGQSQSMSLYHEKIKSPTTWIWLDKDFQEKSFAELKQIIADHEIWLASYEKANESKKLELKKHPMCTNLSKAILYSAFLEGINLSHANMKGIKLHGSTINNATFVGANLSDSNLRKGYFTNISFEYTNLDGADVRSATFSEVKFLSTKFNVKKHLDFIINKSSFDNIDFVIHGNNEKWTFINDGFYNLNLVGKKLINIDFISSKFINTDFTKAELENIDFYNSSVNNAIFSDIKLINVSFNNCDLSFSNFSQADLSNATFKDATLDDVIYEPKTNPKPYNIAFSNGLGKLRYNSDPSKLVKLGQSLYDEGYYDQSKLITTSFKRQKREKENPGFWGWIEWGLFDYTCEYGSNPLKPLIIILYIYLFFSIIYTIRTLFCSKTVLVNKINKDGKEILIPLSFTLKSDETMYFTKKKKNVNILVIS